MESSGLQKLYSARSTSLHATSAEVAHLDPPHSHGHAIHLRLLAWEPGDSPGRHCQGAESFCQVLN